MEPQSPNLDRRWRNRPLELERDHRRTLWLWSMLGALLVTALPAGTYLRHQNECLEVSYEVSALAAARDRMIEEERRLRVRRAELASLAAIERWARREQGLARPTGHDVRVVGPIRAPLAEPTRRASTARTEWIARARNAADER